MTRWLRSVVVLCLALLARELIHAQGDAYTLVTNAPNNEELRNYALGPIGGQYRVTDHATYARIVSINSGGPGAAAGLLAGDVILGVFGKELPPTGQAPSGDNWGGHHGVTEELGFAIDRAEGADGQLPLTILRPGVGRTNVVVQLSALGAYGATYPIASPKYDVTYEKAVRYLHDAAVANNGSLHYSAGWAGLCLLGHPDWNKTTGDRPYRNSINMIRDFVIDWMNSENMAGTEDRFYDGTPNPKAKGGASNWFLGNRMMFLAEYYQKTRDTDDAARVAQVRAALQRGAEMMANSIQWWKQPNLLASPGYYSPSGKTIAGMVSHGGVTGDYIHLGWGGGINICGVHNFMGFSFARRVGVDMTTRPQDGHYFGYTKSEFGTLLNTPGSPFYGIEVVEAGKELYDHTVQEKFLMQWNLLGYRNAGYSTPGDLHDGHVCYQFEGWNPDEAVGKTAATIVGMMMYQADGGQLTSEDIDRLNRMKLFVARNYMRQQDSHAFCVGAQAMTTLSIPFLNDRQQRFLLDNWRFFYSLGRDQDLRFSYFRSRYVNDNYLGEDMPMAINVAMPGAVLNGRLSLVPGLNRSRLIARFDNPDMRWPKYEARLLKSESRVVPMPFTILDGNGAVVDPSQCTIQWTKVSGLGDVTFGVNSITFGSDGIYRVNLRVTRDSYTLDEPIDIIVRSLPVPSGYVAGSADYRVYKDITGATVASLTNHWKFPDFPDEQTRVSSSAGTYSGDNYGSLLNGVILIPVTGTYRFYVASDDASELRINAQGTEGAAGAVVATVSGAVNPANSFKVQASQASAAFQFNAGDVIGFQALQKEGGGADHLSVGWSINGSDPVVIPGHFLAHPVGQIPAMAILSQPVSVRTTLGSSVSLSISTMGPIPAMFQWRKNGVQVSGATDSTFTLADVSAGAEGEYDCTYTTAYGTLVSAKARISVVDVGQIIPGALWQEVYVDIGGSSVSDLTSNPKFPYLADQSGPLTSAATPSLGDNYGQRWSGWITPPTTGNYRFYVASDDEAQVLLSTDSTMAHAVSILLKGGYTGKKQWSARTPSAYIALVAGQKYYIEVRHKEGGGGDHCAVAWQLQGQPAPVNGTGEIPGSVLSYRSGGIYSDTLLSNVAPEFSPASFETTLGFAGKAYPSTSLSTFALDRNSIDLPSLTFAKLTGPSWLTIASNGNLSGTPSVGDVGTNLFTVRVTDPGGLTGQGTLRIVVRPSNVPPTFVASPVKVGNAVSYVRYTGQSLAGKVTDPDTDEAFAFMKLTGPDWLGLGSDGALSGVPTFADAGTNTFTVRVQDIAGNLVTNTLKIVVDPVRAQLSVNGIPGTGSVLTGYNKDANLTLSADILRGSSVVGSVEFSIDGVLLSTDSTAPYTAAWGAIPAGTHVITAKVVNSTPYAAFNLPPITIQVEDPPVVLPRSFVATSSMKFGQILGTAGATLGAGRTLAGWTLLSETNTFDLTTDGVLSLLKPEWLPMGVVKSLRVRATDTTGVAGEGLIHILCNPPVVGMAVNEQRWSGSSAYANQVWTDTPSYTGSLDGFTSASNVGEDFSRRMTGLIRVPTTGDYTFWVASDDGSRLLLSSDDNPANSVQIAYLNKAVGAGNWTGNASQQSAAIRLVAGRAYWLEVHHREIGGGDFVSVAWQGPGFSRRLITSSDLYPPTTVSNPAWIGLDQPTTTDEFIKGQTLTLTTTVVAGTSPITRVDFRSGDTLIGSDATAPYTLDWQGIPDGTLTLTATAVTAAGSVTSDPVNIQVEFVPQVKAATIVATRTMPAGTVVGTMTATVAAGRTISPNGWSITSGNISNAFTMGLNGQIILSRPAQLTAMNTALLGIRATDNAGKSGDGILTVINNPPLTRSVTEERWIDSSTYPNVNWSGAPAYTGTLETFTVHNTASSRTRRISGYIQPAVSGDYRFHVASDDQSELYLSTDHTPANVVKIAYEPSWSGYQSFTGTGTMKSAAIPLIAGKVYYMEARHWVQTGEEHVSVGWTVPGAASAVQVPSSVLFPSYAVSAPAWVGLVTANNSASQLAGVPFTLNSAAVNGTETVAKVEFYQGINRIGTVTNAPFRFTVSSPIAGTYTYVAKALKADGAVIAESLPYAVTVKQNDDLSIDADGDGFSSAIEILLGTDPQNATSFPSSLYTGLVGWWRMDEGTGSALTNRVPLGAAGTVQGTAAWTGGTSGMGLTLDGTSNYVTFGDSAALLGAVDFTASLWVRIQPGTAGGRIVQQRGPNINGQYAADVNSQGKVSFYVYNNGYQFNITTTQSVNDGKWHMLTFTREGVNGRIHIDDVLAASGSGSSAVALASNPFVVGRDQRDQNKYCPGTIDELRLYSRALSDDEVAALYAEPAVLPTAPVFASNPIPASDATVGAAYKTDLTAWTVDPNVRKTDLLTFTRLSGPSWLTINAAGLATGTPAVGDIGSNQWGVRVTDASGNLAEATLSIQVVAENYWNNASGGSWATASNWKTGVVPNGAGSVAWFNRLDIAANRTVSLDGSRTVGRLVFDDTVPSNDWILATGTGGTLTLASPDDNPRVDVGNGMARISAVIAGTQGLMKTGAGSLLLSAANTYTGDTEVVAGKLIANQTYGAFNSTAFRGRILVRSGAVLVFTNSPVGWGGGFTNLYLDGGSFTGTGGFGFGVVYDLKGGVFEGSCRLDLGSYNSIAGTIRSRASDTVSVIRNSNGIFFRGDSGQSTYSFVTEAGTTAGGVDLDIQGGMAQYSGAATVRKEGDGTLALSGASTYTGATLVTAGTLLVNGSLGSTAVTVSAGATLGGTGTIGGGVTVQGTLAPGSLGIGTLTINNSLQLSGTTRMQIQKSGSVVSGDRIAGATSIIAGGVLEVSGDASNFALGDTVTLFNVQPSGSFASVSLPKLPSNLIWQSSQNYRILTVISATAQSLTGFASIPNQTYALGKTVSFTAPTASSGLAVVVTVKSGPAIIVGNAVQLTGVGVVVLAANQPGNATYGAAPEVATSFTVLPGAQEITFNPANRPYSPSSFALGAAASSGLPVSYQLVSGPATLSGDQLTATGTGIVTIRASQPGNALFNAASDVTRTFEIMPATAVVNLVGLDVTYDGKPKSVTATTTPSGLPVNITYGGVTNQPVNAGSIAIQASVVSSNYTGSATGTLVIRKAPIAITAQNQGKTYGSANPRLTAAVTGVPVGAPQPLFTLSTTATTNSAVGSYPITVSADSNPNYQITPKAGTLTISKAYLVVIALDRTRLRGQANPAFVARYSGLKSWDSPGIISNSIVLSSMATSASPLGLYSITVSGPASLPNYTVYYQPGILTVRASAEVVGRLVFYNRSAWDGNSADANAMDDNAVATDKFALRAGSKAKFLNYTSYASGLNGVMVDLFGLPADSSLGADDFEFHAGNTATPSGWYIAPAPKSVSVRRGAGTAGSDRITIIWNANNGDQVEDANEAVAGRWLEVKVKATANTGLGTPDVFYFGNAPGEIGNSATDFWVTTTDVTQTANGVTGVNMAGLTSRFDFNRNRTVDLTDAYLAKARLTAASNALRVLDLTGFAPALASLPRGGLVGLAGEEESASAAWTLPDEQRPSIRTLLSADGAELLLQVTDDGLPWRIQKQDNLSNAAWLNHITGPETGDSLLTWRMPVGDGTSNHWFRLILE